MRRAALALALLLAACAPAASGRVAAEDYRAFFLWAGVRPQPVLDRAETLYLLAGEVRRDGRYLPLRAAAGDTEALLNALVRFLGALPEARLQ